MKIIAVVPARSGSKGVPNKNIKELSGQPLLAYSIMASQKASLIERTIVSTDSDNYAHQQNKFFLDNFCIDDCEDGEVIYLSKELYPVMENQDFVFPTLGASIEYEYNYYNKRGISISGMYLFDNHIDSDNSYYLLDFEIFSTGGYLFKRLDNYKLYFHRNFTNSNRNSKTENIMFGTMIELSLFKSIKLNLNFNNVFYDFDEDTKVDQVKSANIQVKYKFL